MPQFPSLPMILLFLISVICPLQWITKQAETWVHLCVPTITKRASTSVPTITTVWLKTRSRGHMTERFTSFSFPQLRKRHMENSATPVSVEHWIIRHENEQHQIHLFTVQRPHMPKHRLKIAHPDKKMTQGTDVLKGQWNFLSCTKTIYNRLIWKQSLWNLPFQHDSNLHHNPLKL